MDDKLYATIKLSLMSYDFTKEHTSFGDLYQHSKQFKHGKGLKEFTRIVKNMGVFTTVKRIADKTVRYLVYDQTKDAYVNKEITLLKRCDVCNGSGVVVADLTD